MEQTTKALTFALGTTIKVLLFAVAIVFAIFLGSLHGGRNS